MRDDTESTRRKIMERVASAVVSEDEAAERKRLEAQHGQVWDIEQLRAEFEVKGFMAPFVVAIRISTGETGSLLFQPFPRFYFDWCVDHAKG